MPITEERMVALEDRADGVLELCVEVRRLREQVKVLQLLVNTQAAGLEAQRTEIALLKNRG
jgi:hypothetical protein